MKIIFSIVFIAAFLVSCRTSSSDCFIYLDEFVESQKALNPIVVHYSEDKIVTVADRISDTGEKGVFTFSDGRLSKYSFYGNKSEPPTFEINFRDPQTPTRTMGGEVILWSFARPKPDAKVRFTFYLSSVDRNYGEIEISAGTFRKANVKLFEAPLMKVIGAHVEFDSKMLPADGKLYLSGTRQQKCSGATEGFVDSILITKARFAD
jgi:hypothetical protein